MSERGLCISVYGMGYVGLTISAAWLRAGYRIIGVDILREKVEALNRGLITHIEPEVRDEITGASLNHRFEATTDGIKASERSRIKIIAVPIGLNDEGKPLLKSLRDAAEVIAKGMKPGDIVILESSVPPGTTLNFLKPTMEGASGLKAEEDFYLAYSPERIYIGRALKDLEERYPKVIGGIGPRSSRVVGELYSKVARKGVKLVSSPTVAEFEKLAEGVYRDVNIALANELAVLASKISIDYDEVAEVANSQPYCHLHKPGVGVGGACIPVYPFFLIDTARRFGVKMELINTARRINSLMPSYTARLAMQVASKLNLESIRVSILGLAFRGGIDDTRLSPTYDLINVLVKSGVEEIKVNDPYVKKDRILNGLGFKLTADLSEALKGADVVVIATDHPEYRELSLETIKEETGKDSVGVVDGRHMIEDWRNPPRGVVYVGVGRPFIVNL